MFVVRMKFGAAAVVSYTRQRAFRMHRIGSRRVGDFIVIMMLTVPRWAEVLTACEYAITIQSICCFRNMYVCFLWEDAILSLLSRCKLRCVYRPGGCCEILKARRFITIPFDHRILRMLIPPSCRTSSDFPHDQMVQKLFHTFRTIRAELCLEV